MSFFKKNKNPTDTIKTAIMKLMINQTQDNINNFKRSFSAIYNNSSWVLIPGCQTAKGFQLFCFKENGKDYAAIFTDYTEAKKHSGDFASIDITKIVPHIFNNNEIAGIVVDPYSLNFYMEKHFIAECIMYKE